MGSAKPQLGFVRPPFLRLMPRQALPFAIIDVGEPVDRLRFETEVRRDRGTGFTAAAEWARVNSLRFPARRNVTRQRLRLPPTEAGQRQFGAPAEPLRCQPVDMSVAHQNDPAHRCAFGGMCRSAQWAIALTISRPESSWRK